MTAILREMKNEILGMLIPILFADAEQYEADSYADDLGDAFYLLGVRFGALNVVAEKIADQFVVGLNVANKQKFYTAISNGMGFDMQQLIQREGLDPILKASTQQNVGLITSIQKDFLTDVEKRVYTEVMQGTTPQKIALKIGYPAEFQPGKGMTDMLAQKYGDDIAEALRQEAIRRRGNGEIENISRKVMGRAKLIARDQTAKLNASLTQARQQNLGITKYIWRTSEDKRVRDTHKANNGKTFRWSDPPPDTGHPGHDIQCRCIAEAIINA